MKNKFSLLITLLAILLGIVGCTCGSKDASIIVLLGNENQKKELFTPLVKETFDFSKIGNKKTYNLYPKYFGNYEININVFDEINDENRKKIKLYSNYFSDCIEIKLYLDNTVIESRVIELANGTFIGKKNMGITLYLFKIKKEYLEKKITLELKMISTNDDLKKDINEKKIIIRAGHNM